MRMKPEISKETLDEMAQFFLETSIPRLIKLEKEKTEREVMQNATSQN